MSVVTQAADALRAARNKERNPPVATRDTMDDAARDFEDVQLVEDDDVTMLDHELITIRVPKEAKPSMYSFGLPSIMGQGGCAYGFSSSLVFLTSFQRVLC